MRDERDIAVFCFNFQPEKYYDHKEETNFARFAIIYATAVLLANSFVVDFQAKKDMASRLYTKTRSADINAFVGAKEARYKIAR